MLHAFCTRQNHVQSWPLRLALSLSITHCVVPEKLYPYPTHGRDFSYDPLPSGFSKISPQNIPPFPSANSNFSAHPLEIILFLVKARNELIYCSRGWILMLMCVFYFSSKLAYSILWPAYEQKSCGNVLIKNAYLHYNQFRFIILTKQQHFNINKQILKCKFTFKGAGERNALHWTSKNKTIKTVSNFCAKYLRISGRIRCLRLHGNLTFLGL